MDIVKLTNSNGRIYARCPYDARFVDIARKHRGLWLPNVGCWKFPPETDTRTLGDEMEVIYGTVTFSGITGRE